MKTEKSIFDGMTEEELEAIKAGKAETLGENQIAALRGDGALFVCCTGHHTTQKDDNATIR